MKLRKNIAKGLVLGMIIANLPLYSFASNLKNDFYNEISNIKTKEDLQKSAQKAVKSGEVDTWIEGLANMPTSRSCLGTAVVDGKIYCIGGVPNSSNGRKVEVYDPVTDTWETKSNMPTARGEFGTAVIDGKIYCIGGGTGINLNTVEVYIASEEKPTNTAPKLIGNDFELILNQEYNLLDYITVEDLEDKNLVPEVITDLDITKIGNYTATYTVADPQGLSDELTLNSV